MLFDANIILDEEITEEDDINDWWSFVDDDYVKIELVYDGRVIMSGTPLMIHFTPLKQMVRINYYKELTI